MQFGLFLGQHIGDSEKSLGSFASAESQFQPHVFWNLLAAIFMAMPSSAVTHAGHLASSLSAILRAAFATMHTSCAMHGEVLAQGVFSASPRHSAHNDVFVSEAPHSIGHMECVALGNLFVTHQFHKTG